MIFRNEESKRDLMGSWNRPDRPFFASGACHILTAAFLELYTRENFRALHIRPEPGFRGGHIVASDGRTIFDYHGSASHDPFLRHFLAKIRRFFPGWQGSIEWVEESPIRPAFCTKHGLRRPDQFPYNPLPRARAYIRRFESRLPEHRPLLCP
jgi:hypothetical protein